MVTYKSVINWRMTDSPDHIRPVPEMPYAERTAWNRLENSTTALTHNDRKLLSALRHKMEVRARNEKPGLFL